MISSKNILKKEKKMILAKKNKKTKTKKQTKKTDKEKRKKSWFPDEFCQFVILICSNANKR